MRQINKRPLGDILIAEGLITKEQLEIALEEQKHKLMKLGATLVELGMVSEEEITRVRALQLDMPYINLQEAELDATAIAMVAHSVARTYKLIPVSRTEEKITIAMANPMDIEAIDLVHFETKQRVEVSLATEWRIMEAINRHYGNDVGDDIEELVGNASDSNPGNSVENEEEHEDLDDARKQGNTAPIVRMVNMLLAQAIRRKASDIHIEPRRSYMEVRYRVDGELHQMKKVPKKLQPGLISRIKIMSDLDISERRLPQDGRITIQVDGRKVDLRVSTIPSLYGERVVLRILHRSQGIIPLDHLGFSKRDDKIFKEMIKKPYGIVLVTGPTGSGKTTTLYAALKMLYSESINIMTVEDPIEYELDGVNQTNVHHKIGLTFATQLRAILRQDPDVVLVGEIRDSETADVAFRAALTGHLVLSTLHANDAPNTITRLLDMGVEPFLVSSAIIGATAQRLVRVLCPDCKEPYEADSDEKALLGAPTGNRLVIYRAVGCNSCINTGYQGRTTICEVMPMNERLQSLAINKAPATQIREAALAAGMTTMRQDAVSKVLSGVTTIDELQRRTIVEAAFEDIEMEVKAA